MVHWLIETYTIYKTVATWHNAQIVDYLACDAAILCVVASRSDDYPVPKVKLWFQCFVVLSNPATSQAALAIVPRYSQ